LVYQTSVAARNYFINYISDSNEFHNEEEYYDYGGEQDRKSHRTQASVDEYIEDSYTRSNFSGTILTH